MCTVYKGDFPLKIYWNFNGEEVSAKNGIILSKTGQRISVLSIESVQAMHKGNYTCVARNVAGTVEHTATLFINGSHSIKIINLYRFYSIHYLLLLFIVIFISFYKKIYYF